MDCITVTAPAKINLYLDVTGRREDGYHDILSVMQTVSLCDNIALSLKSGGGIRLDCGNSVLRCDESNLAYRAADLMLSKTGACVGVDITLDKHIPLEAGLGGGSSDAAGVLRGLNALLGHPLGLEELCRLGAELGADVPFCVMGGCACATGIGERLERLPDMPGCFIVICCPEERISTPWAYGELDRIHGMFGFHTAGTQRADSMKRGMHTPLIENISHNMYNIFEDVIRDRKDILAVKSIMCEQGALRAMLSGSGPSVFGIFDNERQAQACADMLAASCDTVHLCIPCGVNNI